MKRAIILFALTVGAMVCVGCETHEVEKKGTQGSNGTTSSGTFRQTPASDTRFHVPKQMY